MKILFGILAVVALANAGGISNYGSEVAPDGSPIDLGSADLESGIGASGVQGLPIAKVGLGEGKNQGLDIDPGYYNQPSISATGSLPILPSSNNEADDNINNSDNYREKRGGFGGK